MAAGVGGQLGSAACMLQAEVLLQGLSMLDSPGIAICVVGTFAFLVLLGLVLGDWSALPVTVPVQVLLLPVRAGQGCIRQELVPAVESRAPQSGSWDWALAIFAEEIGTALVHRTVAVAPKARGGPLASAEFAQELRTRGNEMTYNRGERLTALAGRNPADMSTEEWQVLGFPERWKSQFDPQGRTLDQVLDSIFEAARQKKLRSVANNDNTAVAAQSYMLS